MLQVLALRDIDTSVVLATCSRARMLRGALSSLLAEAASWDKPVEIVVVDDGSTDDTADVLADFQQTSAVPFVVVNGHRKGIAAARNLAARNARGVWLASFDDDQIAFPGWLAALRDMAESSGAAFVGGSLALDLPPNRSLDEFGPRARLVLGENLSPPAAPAYRPASNNVLMRRDVFDSLGGYDRTYTEGAEDVDLFDRAVDAHHALVFQPEAKALHVTPHSRLERSNMRWTSIRIGAGDARRLSRKGKTKLLRIAIARAAVASLRDIPQLAWYAIAGNRKGKLDALCSLWYTQGLLRGIPAFIRRGRRGTSRFLRSLDFRSRNGERTDFTVREK